MNGILLPVRGNVEYKSKKLARISTMIRLNDDKGLREILRNNEYRAVYPNIELASGFYPLGEAIRFLNLKAVKAILQHPTIITSNVLYTGNRQRKLSPLQCTIHVIRTCATRKEAEGKEIFRTLVESSKVDLNDAPGFDGRGILFSALEENTTFFLEILLESPRILINSKGPGGTTPLHYTITSRSIRKLDMFLERSDCIVNPGIGTISFRSHTIYWSHVPLIRCVGCGYYPEIVSLIKAGGDPNSFMNPPAQYKENGATLYELNFALALVAVKKEEIESRLSIARFLRQAGGSTFIQPMIKRLASAESLGPVPRNHELIDEIQNVIATQPLALKECVRSAIYKALRQKYPRVSLISQIKQLVNKEIIPRTLQEFIGFK